MKQNPNFENILLRNERVLWNGQPKQGLVFIKSDAFAIPFSIFWMTMVIFISGSGITHFASSENLPTLVDVLFLVICFTIMFTFGVYMSIGRFYFDSLRRARTYYAVTNQRALIMDRRKPGSVKSVSLDSLGELHLEQNSDGTGHILFRSKSSKQEIAHRHFSFDQDEVRMFFGITNALKVYKVIEVERAQSKGTSESLLKAQLPRI